MEYALWDWLQFEIKTQLLLQSYIFSLYTRVAPDIRPDIQFRLPDIRLIFFWRILDIQLDIRLNSYHIILFSINLQYQQNLFSAYRIGKKVCLLQIIYSTVSCSSPFNSKQFFCLDIRLFGRISGKRNCFELKSEKQETVE